MRLATLLPGVAIWVLTACAPSAHGLVKDAPQDMLENCKDCPDDGELRRATETAEQFEFLKRVNAIETALTGRPLAGGNEVELLRDGEATHKAQLEEIAKARHHIHLITYILSDDEVSRRYLDALVERRKAGVKVRFMFDSVGGRTVGDDYFQKARKAGIEVRAFGPVNPAESKGKDWQLSRRHHRKLLITDGKVAFTGGINITDEKRASSGSGTKAEGWRDTHVRMVGPAVAQFQKMFLESWELSGPPVKDDPRYWPKLSRQGNEFVRGVTQQGNDLHEIAIKQVTELARSDEENAARHAIYASYIAAIASARTRIWITQAYFIPNDEFMEALVGAAKRGVDVRVLVPGTSDIKMMVAASRFHYAPLLEAGARIYEYQEPVMHAKTAVIDGVWATVGSSNLDYRSFIHNDEANAIIMGHEFGAKMEQMFRDDLEKAREITREQWAERSWSDRWKQRWAVMWKYWI